MLNTDAWLDGTVRGDVARDRDGRALDDVKTGEPMTAGSVTILYATETGTAEEVAKSLAVAAEARGLHTSLADLADCEVECLTGAGTALIIASTTGEGDVPYAAEDFFRALESGDAPDLTGLRYAVLALGDSSYQQFCAAGRRIDESLVALGASRLAARVDCDIDYEGPTAHWQKTVLDLLSDRPSEEAEEDAAPSVRNRHDKLGLIEAVVIENRLLVGEGSTKATRHLSLALSSGSVGYEVGDALGVIVENDPAMVAAMLAATGLRGDADVDLGSTRLALHEALSLHCEITTATPRFIEAWGQASGSADLLSYLADDKGGERARFLRGHQIIDIVRLCPISGLDAGMFVRMLRPLQPRLYSIASSPRATPGEVHLTVAPVAFALHGEGRAGVATGQLSARAPVGTKLRVYVHANAHFRLPAAEVPIIMIGAGTGVAPYRGFLQERAACPTRGPAWLFFGERNRTSDFLYETEFAAFLEAGILTRIDTAFSRDADDKVYVQHRLIARAAELSEWILAGAHVFVCGDASAMAPDVHQALIDVIAAGAGMSAESAEAYLAAMQKDGRYQRDVY